MAHGGGRYPVYIAPGALAELPALAARHLPGRRTALIADDTVAALYAGYLDGTNPGWRAHDRTCGDGPAAGWRQPVTFPAGESHKTRTTWASLTDQLLGQGLGRDGAVIAVGGGVTGDLAGFVAATYLRGVPVAQVPTTLLAMLDSSVGGKVGVDTPLGKNLVGAFHPPAFVLADPLVLGTLPDREYRAGLAEAVKHGVIADAAHLAWIEAEAEALLRRDLGALVTLIERSIAIKADVVAGDEREEGRRAILNAGHTVGHALEQLSGYELLHGEAVAIGLVEECRLGEAAGLTEGGLAGRLAALLAALGLPTEIPPALVAHPEALAALMGRDKKRDAAGVRMAIPARAGEMARDGGRWTVAVE